MSKNYNPNQPRVPAGNPRGGQWTSDGSGAGSSARKAAGLKTELDEFSENMRDQKKEWAGVFDEDGNMQFWVEGTENKVEFTNMEIEKMAGAVTVHNHPSVSSFSPDDIMLFTVSNQREMIVVDAKFTYSMKRSTWENWDGRGIAIWAQSHDTEKILSMGAFNKALMKVKGILQFENGYPDLSWDDMLEDNDRAWNINHYVNTEFAKIRGWIYTRTKR